MRIGILTLPLHTNYGGILQAYALQTALKRMGHSVKVFNLPLTKEVLPLWKKPLSYSKRFVQKYILRTGHIKIFQEEATYQRLLTRRKFTQTFIDKYINKYPIQCLEQINQGDFDAIVVGSDQVWRMLYFKGLWGSKTEEDAFLAFTEGWKIKRIAYAASFGAEQADISQQSMAACRQAIRQFDKVSVREESAVALCDSLFGVEAQWLIDPTMLLEAKDYLNIAQRDNFQPKREKVLMSYMLDETEEIHRLRAKIAEEKGLQIHFSNIAETGAVKYSELSQPPVESWLQSFVDAEYVITDSFHACVFSILFKKQFSVVVNSHRGGARFASLLKIFNIEDRMIENPADYQSLPPIVYNQIESILETKRAEAFSFLESALS